MSLQDDLRALIVRHCETLKRESEAVADCVTRACGRDGDDLALASAKAIAHRIKGASGSIGFPLVSTMAAALDDRLRAVDGRALSPAERTEILERLEDLRGAIAILRPESSQLYGVVC